ncbi:MAG: YlbF family regulator [Clostridiales bacterium]|nr:YlbF family regulator [Clostridiales bacterium]
MSQHVMDKARELAAAIAQSAEYEQMRNAEDEASADTALEAIYNDYALKQRQVEEETKSPTPDYKKIGDLTRQMEGVEETLRRNQQMQKLTNARTAFSAMMNGVNMELQRVLSPESDEDGCGSDGCVGCSGCSVR